MQNLPSPAQVHHAWHMTDKIVVYLEEVVISLTCVDLHRLAVCRACSVVRHSLYSHGVGGTS